MRKTSNRVEDPEVGFRINRHAESAGLTGDGGSDNLFRVIRGFSRFNGLVHPVTLDAL